MDAAQVDMLLALILPEQRRLTQSCRQQRVYFVSSFAVLLVLYVVIFAFRIVPEINPWQWNEYAWWAAFGVVIGSLFAYWICYDAIERKVRPGLLALSAIEDVRAAGPLLDALGEGYMQDTVLLEALNRILLQFRPADAEVLTEEQRQKLSRTLERCLSYPGNVGLPLGIAILQTYSQIGDSRELPLVGRLAKGLTWTKRGKQLQEAAWTCLPNVQARAGEQQSSTTLLRASQAVLPGEETLLRSSQQIQEVAPDQLLRATAEDDVPREVAES